MLYRVKGEFEQANHRLSPIWASLPEGSHLILSPDHGLALFPFEMAPHRVGALIDHFLISYVNTGRNLLRPHSPGPTEHSPPLILAAPDYGPCPEAPPGQDGMLTAEEVTTLHLHGTELVVLSACQSGLGDIRRGEGVFGLRRAFTFAGARRPLISLWPVEDEPTKEFMSCFYSLLLEGLPFVNALRQARLQIREWYPEPRVWAAFIGVGEPSGIEW